MVKNVFVIDFFPGWDGHFNKMDASTRSKIGKKIEQLPEILHARHLKHGFPFFVVEVGQCRIVFKQENNIRTIYFVGNHKQYERFYRHPLES